MIRLPINSSCTTFNLQLYQSNNSPGFFSAIAIPSSLSSPLLLPPFKSSITTSTTDAVVSSVSEHGENRVSHTNSYTSQPQTSSQLPSPRLDRYGGVALELTSQSEPAPPSAKQARPSHPIKIAMSDGDGGRDVEISSTADKSGSEARTLESEGPQVLSQEDSQTSRLLHSVLPPLPLLSGTAMTSTTLADNSLTGHDRPFTMSSDCGAGGASMAAFWAAAAQSFWGQQTQKHSVSPC